MDIQVETLDISHAEDVQRLSGQLGYPLSVEEIETNIREIGLAPNNCCFIAIADGKKVGWIHAFKAVLIESKPFIEIGGLIVDENYRGKGVGRRLFDTIKQWCNEMGVREIRVRSNVTRTEAHQFYKALGFTDFKQQKVFKMEL